MLFWFLDNLLVRIVAHLMKVYCSLSFLLADRIYTIPIHIVLLLMYNCNSGSCRLFSQCVFS